MRAEKKIPVTYLEQMLPFTSHDLRQDENQTALLPLVYQTLHNVWLLDEVNRLNGGQEADGSREEVGTEGWDEQLLQHRLHLGPACGQQAVHDSRAVELTIWTRTITVVSKFCCCRLPRSRTGVSVRLFTKTLAYTRLSL